MTVDTLLDFYRRGRAGVTDGAAFDRGIESALQLILASPEFLMRFEADPPNLAPNTPYRLGDLALASRLAFFLWSSPPDDQLLTLASQGKLKDPVVLEQQVKRMLADSRSQALVTNFAEQWLHLRNLKSSSPDLEAFPDFDDNLRQSMKEETSLFFNSIVREDRSVVGPSECRLHVRQRAAGAALRHSQRLRQSVPPVTVANERSRGLLGQASRALPSPPIRIGPRRSSAASGC
jgi:hypothetical protein